MKVLVTGATGFIGNYVIKELLARHIEVVATATSLQKAEEKDWYNKITFVAHTIDEKSEEQLFEKFERPDVLIHLAWQGLPNYKQLFHFEEVLPKQYSFIKTLVAQGLSDVTITGTCFEYGLQEGCLREDMPTAPANPYALAKDTLRKFLEAYQTVHPFSFKWSRLFYMYGKGQSPSSILSQLDKALEHGDATFNMSKGDQLRDYLPVETVAANIVSIALQQAIDGVINCCSGTPISIKELVDGYLKIQQKEILFNLGYYPYPDYEPKAFWGDDTRLKEIILSYGH